MGCLGRDHIDTGNSICGLANALEKAGRLDEATTRWAAALEILKCHYGHGSPQLFPVWFGLGELEERKKNWPAARRSFALVAVECAEYLFGPDAPRSSAARGGLCRAEAALRPRRST